MECVSLPRLSTFAVCGGTHGNEMTGVYMFRHLQKQEVEHVAMTTVLSNPRAVDACRRYTETDLNRCFTNELLSAPLTDSSPYELRRAQEINALLGPKGSSQAVDLVCDLHNTTSNMGLTAMFFARDPVAGHIYKYLKSKIRSVPVRAIQSEKPLPDAFSLESLGKHGMTLEIGPQPNGVVRADIFNVIREALDLTLEWLRLFNSGTTFEGGEEEAFVSKEKVDFPRDPCTGDITATIHPQLQDRDFQLIQAGDPIFLSFSGDTLLYQGQDAHPFFINECAYYEKRTAFVLGEKVRLKLPSIRLQTEQKGDDPPGL